MTTTLTRKWAAVGLVAAALAATTAWAVLTPVIDTATQPTKAPVTTTLSASERADLSGLASMDDARLAAAYGTARRGQPSTATVLKHLRPAERRYVRAILALTPEQLRAGFGTTHP
jgi:hypothetical protein